MSVTYYVTHLVVVYMERLCEVKYVYVGIVFTCSTLHLFPYPVPAGDQGSVQHLTLRGVPVDVFINVLSYFSEVKELKCDSIHPPQNVQCVHMYMQCGLVCTSLLYQSLFDSV